MLASDPFVDASEMAAVVEPVPLEELLPAADVVTLHVNLCEATRGFFGKDRFAAMKPGGWFVNTARGELVDEEALLHGLQSGHLAGTALDVLCGEGSSWMASHRLVAYSRSNPRLIVTPHIGGCSFKSMEKTELFLAEKLVGFLRGTSSGGEPGRP